jgi:medium-chain acyl-[acyl-carrier-protein] hydrolase
MDKYTKKYNVILDNMDLFEYRLRPISAIMYIQDAFARLCGTKRLAAYDLFSTNQYWIVTEFNIIFVDELPFWSEEIAVNIWISEITKLKIYSDYEIIYKNKPFAKGNALWFIVNKETKRPAKTDIAAEKFNICNELALGEHKKFILPDVKEKVSEIIHTNNLSDIDFNKHVNNKSYINLAEMTANDEFRKTHTLKSLNIRFNKETFLGDTLTCSTYKTNIDNTYTHIVEKDGISVCDISTSWTKKEIKNNIVNYDLEIKRT